MKLPSMVSLGNKLSATGKVVARALSDLFTAIKNFFRAWKIYIEVAEILILAALGYQTWTNSVIANEILSRQTQLQERQTIVSEIALLPRLVVNLQSDKKLGESLKVFNEGAMLSDARSNSCSLLKVHYGTISVSIPLHGYFLLGIESHKPTGLIVDFPSGNARLAFSALLHSFNTKALGQGTDGWIEAKHYFEVSYSDVFKKDHVEYFEMSNQEVNRISGQEGERAFILSSRLSNIGSIDVRGAMPQDILSLVRRLSTTLKP